MAQKYEYPINSYFVGYSGEEREKELYRLYTLYKVFNLEKLTKLMIEDGLL